MAPRKDRGPDAQEYTGVVLDLPSQPCSREPLDTARERIFRLGRKASPIFHSSCEGKLGIALE